MLPYLKGGVVNLFFTVRYQWPITKNQQLCITYFTMTISTKTNSTALSYLSIITNKTVEMIAMTIFKFVEVATQSHRHEETGGLLKVLRRGSRSFTWIEKGVSGKWSE